MGYSTIHQPCPQDRLENSVATRPQEQGLARSLRTMVRRVLRRRRSRTRFEVRVLAEARRLMESHGCEFSSDALARVITDRLLASPNRNEFLGYLNPNGDAQVGTWANAVGNTVAV